MPIDQKPAKPKVKYKNMHHHRLKREILVVEVPEKAHNFWIMPILYKDITCQLRFDDHWGHDGTCEKTLVPGNWQFLSKGNEITPEQCAEIMESGEGKFGIEWYNDYSFQPKKFFAVPPLESFQSFLKSNNYTPEKVVILVKEK